MDFTYSVKRLGHEDYPIANDYRTFFHKTVIKHLNASDGLSGSLDHFVFLPVYAMPKKKGRK